MLSFQFVDPVFGSLAVVSKAFPMESKTKSAKEHKAEAAPAPPVSLDGLSSQLDEATLMDAFCRTLVNHMPTLTREFAAKLWAVRYRGTCGAARESAET